MAGWVSARGATLAKLYALGGLWVVERLPAPGAPVECWSATAEKRDGGIRLLGKWANDAHMGKLPRPLQARQKLFFEAARRTPNLVLVVRDAHLLRADVYDQLHTITERRYANTCVVMEGEIGHIRATGRSIRSFALRTSFLVHVDEVFDQGEG